MSRALALGLALAFAPSFAAPSPLASQEAQPRATAVTRIRVTAPAMLAAPLEGTFVSFRGDTLLMRQATGEVHHAFPVDEITTVEVARGRRYGRALLFAGVGTFLGAMLAQAAPSEGIDMQGAALAAGSILGATVGLVTGLISAPTQWVSVPPRSLQ